MQLGKRTKNPMLRFTRKLFLNICVIAQGDPQRYLKGALRGLISCAGRWGMSLLAVRIDKNLALCWSLRWWKPGPLVKETTTVICLEL